MLGRQVHPGFVYIKGRGLIFHISILLLILPACSYNPYISHTKKSGLQQLLVAKALDHALQKATLDVEGAKIFIDVNSQMRFQNPYFEKAFEHWFLKKRALLTEEKKKADYIASIIVKSAGTNGSQFGLGLPAMSVPLTSISTPQLAIFSGYNQKGYAEIEMILYSQEIGLKEITGPLVGETFYKEYTIIFIPISSQNIY